MSTCPLTYGIIQKRLQIANCCAAKQGSAMIDKMNRGKSCSIEQSKIQRIFDYIDSISEYISLGSQNEIFDDSDTCLETNEIISILDALCELCPAPCTTYVNFGE